MLSFIFPWHVDFADTDAGGVVYHTRYLEWAERARAAMLRQFGFSNIALQQRGIIFAVHTLQMQYHKPARLDDGLIVSTVVQQARGARLEIVHSIQKNQETLVSIELTLACLGIDSTPRRLPPELRRALAPS
jgi:acyl-CoA thioester hydrolase